MATLRKVTTLKRGRQPLRIVGDAADPDGMVRCLHRYLEHLGIRGYTEHTRWNVERYVGEFLGWCEPRALSRPSEITRPILESYQRHLYYYRKKNGAPLSTNSQRSKLLPLRGWFKWLTRQNVLLSNPASELELPRRVRRLPRHVLTVEEAEAVLVQADLGDPLGIRDRAVLETVYSTGLRRMELANLKVDDLDAERGTVMVRAGKGRKDRLIPIGERASRWIERYLTEVRPKLVMPPDEGTLFLTQWGEAFNLGWLSTTVAQYVERANLGKHGACHLFRHTMATLMLEHGCDIRFIQAMLGHAELSTTQIYTQVAIRVLKQMHTATHPANMPREGAREREEPSVMKNEPDLNTLTDALNLLLSALDAEAEEERRDLRTRALSALRNAPVQ